MEKFMTQYELKQAAKKSRYAEIAKKLETQAQQLYVYDCQQIDAIPAGQPVLVGHHSEKRHRSALARSHKRIEKICELNQKAEYFHQKATSNSKAISSDDETAVKKLKIKLAGLEEKQEQMKHINVTYHKNGNIDAINTLTDDDKLNIKIDMERFRYNQPYPSFYLTNNSAEIRRIKARIAQLEKVQAEPAKDPIHGNGYTVTENKEDNRIYFEFNKKPSSEICQAMRTYGFKWSPTRMAWVRMLNAKSRNRTYILIEKINEFLIV